MITRKSFRLLSNIFNSAKCSSPSFFKPSARTYYVGNLEGPNEPFHPIAGRFPVWASSAEEAFPNRLKSGDQVFIHGSAATPTFLLDSMIAYGKANNLKDITLYHILVEGTAPFNNADCDGIFRSNSFFTGENCRKAVNEGRADFTPIFLSEIPHLFRRKHINLDLALISVTPPDKHGFCSLGPTVDCTRAAIQNAKVIIGQVNPNLPNTRGDSSIHVSHIDVLFHGPMKLHEMKSHVMSENENKIGRIIANELVEDGATLQMGFGSIPGAVLSHLGSHQNLGIHTEMFSDSLVELVDSGAVTNAMKKRRQGKIIASFVIGTKKSFDFLDDNPFVEMCDIEWVNNSWVIAQNPKVCAINQCIEVDLTGQVVSDSLGPKIYSGVGGQLDFIRGASLCVDGRGKPIIAVCSSTSRGTPRIVPFIHEGAGVVTTRAHVHYVVTEYGIAYLFGKNLRQRAHALIKIAHPNHQAELEKAAFERLKCMPSPD